MMRLREPELTHQDSPGACPKVARLTRWGALLALGGLLLFAHGCHADQDNELFALVRTLLRIGGA